ncbi:MAG: flagellin, partial [Myxococcota bacterium]
MALNVNTNVTSLIAQRNLGRAQNSNQKSLKQLSTGLRINSAADDSAGLAISTKFKSQLRSMDQAQRNANDGISLIQTAEGALEQMGGTLNRARELAVQSSNDTLTASDRSFIDSEFRSLVAEMDRIVSTTEFNGRKLLNGSAS